MITKRVLAFFFFSFFIINRSLAQDTAFLTKGFYVTKDPYMLRCAQKQPDGRVLISGDFTHFNGVRITNLIRLMEDGKRDTTFDKQIGTDGTIQHISVQDDGKIILQGVFNRYKQQAVATGLIRITANGVLDNSFNAYKPLYNYNGVTAMALQADGKILLAGFGLGTKGYDTTGIIRLNSNGTLDNSFAIGNALDQYDFIRAITVQQNGKIVVGGSFNSWNGASATSIIRLNSNGQIDNSFVLQGSGLGAAVPTSSPVTITTIRELPDSSLFIGGNFAFYDTSKRMGIVKLLKDGSLDTSFYQDPSIPVSTNFIVQDIGITNQNKILLGGHFYTWNNLYSNLIVLQPNGLLDSLSPFSGPDPTQPFSAGGITDIFVNADNSFLAFGPFAGVYNGIYQNNLALYNSQHQIDTSFHNGFQRTGSVIETIPQADNKVLVVGDFNQYGETNGSPRQYIARLHKDGSLDTTYYNTDLNGRVSGITQQNDSSILAVGSFSKVGNVNRNAVARFNKNGLLDNTFDPGVGPDNPNMYCVRSYNNQYIYVGGGFSRFGNTAHQGIVRLLSDGRVDNTFNTTTTPIYAPASIEVTQDGKVLVAESSDRTTRDYSLPLRLYKLMSDGSLDNSFQTPRLGWSLGMKVLEGKNGSVYWLGWLIQASSPNSFQQTLICLKQDGSLDSSANRLPSDYVITDFSLLPDSNILVCGQKITGTDSTNFVMRLKSDLSVDSSFNPVALYYNLKHINHTPEGNIVIAGEANRYFRLNEDQIQNVGLLKNSSLQIESSDGAVAAVVNNIIDSVSIKQSVSLGTSTIQDFTAVNPSNINLSLLDPKKVIITGPNASEFSVSFTNNSSVISKKQSLPFKITFTPASEGSKSVTITIPYSNGIDNKYSFTLTGNATGRITAVDNVPGENNGIYLYPNPSSVGKVYIRSKNTINHYSVVDIAGKKVLSGLFSSPSSEYKEVPLLGLMPGVYFIKLKGKKTNESVKLIVTK